MTARRVLICTACVLAFLFCTRHSFGPLPLRAREHRQRLGILALRRCAGHAQAATGGHALYQSRHLQRSFAREPLRHCRQPHYRDLRPEDRLHDLRSPIQPTSRISLLSGSRASASRSTAAGACRSPATATICCSRTSTSRTPRTTASTSTIRPRSSTAPRRARSTTSSGRTSSWTARRTAPRSATRTTAWPT